MMSRWCDQSIPTRDIPHFPVALYEVAVLFGTVVAKTILASVHVRAHKQAGHMDASDLIKTLQYTLQGGGRPHMENRESGSTLKQQAVLFRTSHHCGPLEVELTRRNIPFIKYGGLKFLDTAHIRDILALLPEVSRHRAY